MARPTRAVSLLGVGLLGVALWAAASPARAQAVRVFLIGDAGAPDPAGEPVLAALRGEVARQADRSLVVFLGDNIYPRGLPTPGDPGRAEAERRLRAQIDAVRDTGARALFLPGNHDWDRHGHRGWDLVRRQAAFIETEMGSQASFLPKDGCPGPAVVDVSDALRLVVLDTQWWLHGGPKPRGEASGCTAATEVAVATAITAALAEAGPRSVVVLAHHPLVSGGGHGGHFSWQEHVFPLRDWKGWLWLPLPGLGSVYPLARRAGVFSQDVSAPGYRHMRDALEAAMRAHRPLVWASGHEHGLQVLKGTSARHMLVSGAGIYGHTKAPRRIGSTLFASGEAGFMRLDFGASPGPRLTVLEVDERGRAHERFAMPLE